LITVEKTTDEPIKIASEIVADKGYHSRERVRELNDLGFRTYISEPDRPPQRWIDQHAERDAVYANRRRIQGVRSTAAAEARGIVGTPERAPVRDWRHAANALARSR
jgi:transposase